MEIALSLAQAGCDLVIHFHRSADEAAHTVKRCRGFGVQVVSAPADLSRSEGIFELFRQIDTAFGGVDLLVNSAAVLERVDLLSATDQDWQSTVGLNLKGAFFCLQQAARRMVQRGRGSIVNISDTAGVQAWERFPLHSISKAGLEMLTRVSALALAPKIQVNAVIPGPTLKPAWMKEQRWREIGAALPAGEIVPPQDVAKAVLFLLRSEYITGHSIRVDAGALLR
jgi:NAD(P)-dependent dehydrogenase (short-subunit alcohol dehydrogenase family)